jgi:hypothetical protein
MNFTDYFVLAVFAIIIYCYVKKQYGEVEYVKSKVDGKKYLVRRLHDSQKAADMLAELANDCQTLVRHLLAKYKDRPETMRLYQNFNRNEITEGSPDSGYTSYSINKTSIVLCLRQKESHDFAEKNVIRYVLYHELAHLMTESIGHTKEFWDNFKFMLAEAVSIGLYVKQDYNNKPMPYCGIRITSSVI